MTTTPPATPETVPPPAAVVTEAPPAYPVRSWGDIRQAVDTRGLVTKTIESPEFRATFKVRGLTRAEKHHLNSAFLDPKTGRLDAGRVEEEMLVMAVVEPPLRHEDYKSLRHNAAINPVFDRLLAGISELTNGVAPADDGTASEDALAAAERRFRAGQ